MALAGCTCHLTPPVNLGFRSLTELRKTTDTQAQASPPFSVSGTLSVHVFCFLYASFPLAQRDPMHLCKFRIRILTDFVSSFASAPAPASDSFCTPRHVLGSELRHFFILATTSLRFVIDLGKYLASEPVQFCEIKVGTAVTTVVHGIQELEKSGFQMTAVADLLNTVKHCGLLYFRTTLILFSEWAVEELSNGTDCGLVLVLAGVLLFHHIHLAPNFAKLNGAKGGDPHVTWRRSIAPPATATATAPAILTAPLPYPTIRSSSAS
ncbi:hypothetical protein HYFRA_00007508 [Hymenoscyphus fraxineus]|uniref:Uncharacterized protein n=1 Tax=Hymenoscyphus fraxineus TaxID=746836 RepID=A0A9N9PRL3_9HELO|nr:hypothetical protein HYFRA_00007508 [Hymenoscyphus fraxineus]